MNWIFEHTMPIVLMTGVVIVSLIGGYIQTGKRALLYAVGGVAALGLTLLIVGQVVVTEREKIRETIFAVAGAVERNDMDGVLKYLSVALPDVRRRVESEFPRYEFGDVSIKRNLKIEMEAQSQPPKGVATFNATVVVTDKTGFVKNRRVPRFVSVTFYLEDGRWVIGDYSHADPRQGF